MPGWMPVDPRDRSASNLSDTAVESGNQVMGPINAPKGLKGAAIDQSQHEASMWTISTALPTIWPT